MCISLYCSGSWEKTNTKRGMPLSELNNRLITVNIFIYSISTGPVCSLKPVRRAPVNGLKEFPHTGGLSIRERNELPS